jgi:RHS repeat-associated protein
MVIRYSLTASTGPTGSSNITYSFPDSQNSTNVVTDASSYIQQTLDYYPYGSTRINSGSDVSARKYIGQFADASGLDYFNARYLAPSQGQFISQDPVFLGDPKSQNLIDPQALGSYSYANGNPITKSDPSGKCIICAGLEVGYSLCTKGI